MSTYRFALATTIATFVLLIAGGLVHATGSALACPDWPLCYGQFLPPMTGGVQYEHTHRLIAAAVTLMTVALAWLLWRSKGVRWLGIGAVGLVLVQATLGGITVLLRLPTLVSTAHLAVSMLFFSLLVYITVRVHPVSDSPDAKPVSASVRGWVGIATVALYLQILLGAFVRHTKSGLACVDIPLCGGQVWPVGHPRQIHMLHRYMAVVVAGLIIWSTVRVLRARRKGASIGKARVFASASHALVILQIALGVGSVQSFLEYRVVTAHLAVGALLLADMVALHTVLAPRRASAVARETAPAEGSVGEHA